jgi:hypothetical protein
MQTTVGGAEIFTTLTKSINYIAETGLKTSVTCFVWHGGVDGNG